MEISSLKGARVLVLDDERLVAEDIAEALLDQQAEICGPLFSLAEALEWIAFSGNLIHGAVLDIYLGGKPCWPVADELLARGIPFIFLSGFLDMGLPDKYAAVPRCSKPCEPHLLTALLAAEMWRSRQM